MLKQERSFYFYPLTIVLLSIGALLLSNSHFSPSAFTILLRQSAILGILSIGLGIVVVAGGIDFSVGAILSLSSDVCAIILSYGPNFIWPAIICAILLSALCGLCNGALIAYFRFPAFLVTFIQILIYSSIFCFSDSWHPITVIPHSFQFLSTGQILGIPICALLWLLLLAISSLAMRCTYWGHFIYALGDNKAALNVIGIHTLRYEIAAYTLCGLFAGTSGVLMLARVSSATASTNIPLVLEALAVLALSGVSFSGSYGKLSRLFIGTITISLVKLCMIVYALNSQIQNMILSLLVLGSLFIDRVIHKKQHFNTQEL